MKQEIRWSEKFRHFN